MNDALVFATKYVNTEAATPFIIIFAYDIVFFASALTYFVAKTCASYISCCVNIHRYLVYIERRNIRQVMLNSAIQHFSEFADSEDTNIMISTKSLSLKPLKVATDVSCMHLI